MQRYFPFYLLHESSERKKNSARAEKALKLMFHIHYLSQIVGINIHERHRIGVHRKRMIVSVQAAFVGHRLTATLTVRRVIWVRNLAIRIRMGGMTAVWQRCNRVRTLLCRRFVLVRYGRKRFSTCLLLAIGCGRFDAVVVMLMMCSRTVTRLWPMRSELIIIMGGVHGAGGAIAIVVWCTVTMLVWFVGIGIRLASGRLNGFWHCSCIWWLIDHCVFDYSMNVSHATCE